MCHSLGHAGVAKMASSPGQPKTKVMEAQEALPALPPGEMQTHGLGTRSPQKSIGRQEAETRIPLLFFIETTASYLGCSRHDSTLLISIVLEIKLQSFQIIALLALYYSFCIIYLH